MLDILAVLQDGIRCRKQGNIPLLPSEIEENRNLGRRATLIIPNSHCVSFAEDNIIDVLKNTKKI